MWGNTLERGTEVGTCWALWNYCISNRVLFLSLLSVTVKRNIVKHLPSKVQGMRQWSYLEG